MGQSVENKSERAKIVLAFSLCNELATIILPLKIHPQLR